MRHCTEGEEGKKGRKLIEEERKQLLLPPSSSPSDPVCARAKRYRTYVLLAALEMLMRQENRQGREVVWGETLNVKSVSPLVSQLSCLPGSKTQD